MRSSATAHLKLHQKSLADYEAQYGAPTAVISSESNTGHADIATCSPVTEEPLAEQNNTSNVCYQL